MNRTRDPPLSRFWFHCSPEACWVSCGAAASAAVERRPCQPNGWVGQAVGLALPCPGGWRAVVRSIGVPRPDWSRLDAYALWI